MLDAYHSLISGHLRGYLNTDLRAQLYMCERKKVEWWAWSTFFAGVNVWKSDLPGCQKAQITAIIVDC